MFNQNTVESNGIFTYQFRTYSGEFYPEMVVSAGYDFSKKDLRTFFHGEGTVTDIHGIESSGTWEARTIN